MYRNYRITFKVGVPLYESGIVADDFKLQDGFMVFYKSGQPVASCLASLIIGIESEAI